MNSLLQVALSFGLLWFVDKCVQVSLAERKPTGNFFQAFFRVCAIVVKYVVAVLFVLVLFVATNYAQIKEQVMQLLQDDFVTLVRNFVNFVFGSPSVYLAIQKTATLAVCSFVVALLRSVSLFGFVFTFIYFVARCVSAVFYNKSNAICSPARQTSAKGSWLVLCRFIS